MSCTPTANSRGIVLFDTNVWMAYFLDAGEKGRETVGLIQLLQSQNWEIATTPLIEKDLFHLVPREIRRRIVAEIGDAAWQEGSPAAGAAVAWGVLERVDDLATVVPIAMQQDFFARHLREQHDDYEDGLLMAVARSISAQAVATYDKGLRSRFPSVCQTPREMTSRLERAASA